MWPASPRSRRGSPRRLQSRIPRLQERCRSGRTGSPAKRVIGEELIRGFESPSLRSRPSRPRMARPSRTSPPRGGRRPPRAGRTGRRGHEVAGRGEACQNRGAGLLPHFASLVGAPLAAPAQPRGGGWSAGIRPARQPKTAVAPGTLAPCSPLCFARGGPFVSGARPCGGKRGPRETGLAKSSGEQRPGARVGAAVGRRGLGRRGSPGRRWPPVLSGERLPREGARLPGSPRGIVMM